MPISGAGISLSTPITGRSSAVYFIVILCFSAIERGLRAIVTFQERVGEEPLKREVSETEEILGEITPNFENQNNVQQINLEDDEEFKKIAILRDQELELHFKHLKIEILEN